MMQIAISESLIVNALLELAAVYQSRLQKVSLQKTIVLLRKKLRMSQKTLAIKAKIPTSTLSRIESGARKPSFRTMEKIFKGLFCDIAIIPLPEQDLDQIVEQQIRKKAEKRVQYLKGTMALELQRPREEAIKELVKKEMRELESENSDIWDENDEL